MSNWPAVVDVTQLAKWATESGLVPKESLQRLLAPADKMDVTEAVTFSRTFHAVTSHLLSQPPADNVAPARISLLQVGN